VLIEKITKWGPKGALQTVSSPTSLIQVRGEKGRKRGGRIKPVGHDERRRSKEDRQAGLIHNNNLPHYREGQKREEGGGKPLCLVIHAKEKKQCPINKSQFLAVAEPSDDKALPRKEGEKEKGKKREIKTLSMDHRIRDTAPRFFFGFPKPRKVKRKKGGKRGKKVSGMVGHFLGSFTGFFFFPAKKKKRKGDEKREKYSPHTRERGKGYDTKLGMPYVFPGWTRTEERGKKGKKEGDRCSTAADERGGAPGTIGSTRTVF